MFSYPNIQIECQRRPVKDLYCCLTLREALGTAEKLIVLAISVLNINADCFCELVKRFQSTIGFGLQLVFQLSSLRSLQFLLITAKYFVS